MERLVFSTFNPKDADTELQIYSIVNKVSRIKGLKALKAEQQNGNRNVRVVVGGGDGTVLWAVEEMLKAGIDFSHLAVGVIPFGTGNDFSRVLGWGGKIFAQKNSKLSRFASTCIDWRASQRLKENDESMG